MEDKEHYHVQAASMSILEARVAAIEAKLAAKPMILNWDALNNLPVDLAEAVEQCKLAIIRHRASKWDQISQQKFLDVLAALAKFAEQE